MPLTPGMCPRAIKAEHRGIYVKMSISTTGAQFPWTRKCVVSRRNAGKNSRHLYRAWSFGRGFFFPWDGIEKSAKVKMPREINAQQNGENFNIVYIELLRSRLSWPRIISRILRVFIITYIFYVRKNIIINCSLFILVLFLFTVIK